MPPNACAKSRGEWWRSEGGRSHRGSEGAKSAKSTLAWAPPVQGTSTIPDAALQALCSRNEKYMQIALGANGAELRVATPGGVQVTCPLAKCFSDTLTCVRAIV